MDDTATNIEIAQLVISLTDTTREFLKLMNFHEIPEEAHSVAFFEDGEALFLEDSVGMVFGPGDSFVTFVTGRRNVPIDMSYAE